MNENEKSYELLINFSKKNRELYLKGNLTFREYIDNHEIISNKLKKSILSFEEYETLSLVTVDKETCLNKFHIGINILRLNFN